MPPNPFFYGNPVPPAHLIGRRPLLRRIVGRILNQGQSSALVGEPRLGKTSLLHFLAAPATQQELYGSEANRLIFTLVNSQTLAADCPAARFWEQALQPLKAQRVDAVPATAIAQQYREHSVIPGG